MSVVIRLSKIGRRGEARFRVVVSEKRSRRDGKPIEILGWYEKRQDSQNKNVNMERYNYWVSKGGIPSQTVLKIVK
ncbi:MAG: 30S ribosomal protein S16 [Candidatus Levybacteria bacterium]|nr:30S ribosomal protein S16 [Candidatus Levybacteria bacterium]